MSSGAEAKTSNLQFNGKLPWHYATEAISFSTTAAVTDVGAVCPGDSEIAQCLVRVLASSTSTLARINIGNQTTADAYLKDYQVTNVAAGTVIDIPLTASQWQTLYVARGVQVKAQGEQATTAGSVAISLVLAPRKTGV